jgi:hypothetical protein
MTIGCGILFLLVGCVQISKEAMVSQEKSSIEIKGDNGPNMAVVKTMTRDSACNTINRLAAKRMWLGSEGNREATSFEFIPGGFKFGFQDGDQAREEKTLYADIKELRIHVGGDWNDWISVFVNTSQGGNREIFFSVPNWIREGQSPAYTGIRNDDRALKALHDANAWMNALAAIVKHPDWQDWMVNGEDEIFKTALKEYRDSGGKLQLPEEARKYYEQAQGAVEDKSFDEAIELYEKALDIAPWWPIGYYNCSLIMADQGDYTGAINYANKYVQLMPDASDAREVQDKIYKWERKAEKGASPSGGGKTNTTGSFLAK